MYLNEIMLNSVFNKLQEPAKWKTEQEHNNTNDDQINTISLFLQVQIYLYLCWASFMLHWHIYSIQSHNR